MTTNNVNGRQVFCRPIVALCEGHDPEAKLTGLPHVTRRIRLCELMTVYAVAAILWNVEPAEAQKNKPNFTQIDMKNEIHRRALTSDCAHGAGKDFVRTHARLLTAFDVNNNGGTANSSYTKPTPGVLDGTGTLANTQYALDLADAFNAAPMFFKNQLCRLSAVYIDNVSQGGTAGADWGFWEAIDQRVPPRAAGRYIGISGNWWNMSTTSKFPILSQHEKFLNENLLADTTHPTNNYPDIISYTSPIRSIDTPAMGLLAALAHEMGHIIWYSSDLIDDDNCTIAGDTPADFFDGSWRVANLQARFHGPGQPEPNASIHANRSDPTLATIIADAQKNDSGSLATDLQTIYSSGTWMSLFSSVAPDEDLAETYKYVVLNNAATPLQSLLVSINTATAIDVMKNATSTSQVSAGKFACMLTYGKNWHQAAAAK